MPERVVTVPSVTLKKGLAYADFFIMCELRICSTALHRT